MEFSSKQFSENKVVLWGVCLSEFYFLVSFLSGLYNDKRLYVRYMCKICERCVKVKGIFKPLTFICFSHVI